jgi:hypothetical protein
MESVPVNFYRFQQNSNCSFLLLKFILNILPHLTLVFHEIHLERKQLFEHGAYKTAPIIYKCLEDDSHAT